ncbi:MAG: ABC transporter substrate-binding protein [Chloroflexi bacterium]|nr:ABC transporter substrate-binding protein [Chloroflexota bacterium]
MVMSRQTYNVVRTVSLVTSLWVLVLSASSCGRIEAAVPAAERAPQELVHVSMFVLPYLGYAPVFIAQDAGHFARHGLEVEFIDMQSSLDATAMVMQGKLDAASVQVTAGLFNAIGQGGQARVVLSGSQHASAGCAYASVIAVNTRALELSNMDSWRGRAISVGVGGATGVSGYSLSKVLEQGNLTTADLTVERLEPATALDALKTGKLDFALCYEPWLTLAGDTVDAIKLIDVKDVLEDAQVGVIVFGPRLLADREIGVRFIQAYLDAVEQYRQGPTEANVEILARHTGLEPDLLSRACWADVPADGRINEQSIAEFQSWALTNGELDALVPADVFYVDEFRDEAVRRREDTAR